MLWLFPPQALFFDYDQNRCAVVVLPHRPCSLTTIRTAVLWLPFRTGPVLRLHHSAGHAHKPTHRHPVPARPGHSRMGPGEPSEGPRVHRERGPAGRCCGPPPFDMPACVTQSIRTPYFGSVLRPPTTPACDAKHPHPCLWIVGVLRCLSLPKNSGVLRVVVQRVVGRGVRAGVPPQAG